MRRIKIKFNIGVVDAITDKDKFSTNKCKHCGKKIYFVKAIGMKKFMASKLRDGSYIIHHLVCEELLKRARTAELRNMSKKYDKRKNKKYNRNI